MVASLFADDLVHATRMTCAEFGLPRKIISDAGMNFTSETFRDFFKKLKIQQSITSSYHHQGNSQVEACIKVVKYTIKKALLLTKLLILPYYRYDQHQ